jgi:catechol 2,3-dioxygenase-like lactoylglutathione lyase family enzyme
VTSTASGTPTGTEQVRCGCCGRWLPPSRMAELGNTPGVYICSRCALWAARRASRVPGLRADLRQVVHRLNHLVRAHRHPQAGEVLGLTPVLAGSDLDRTITYYRSLGFDLVEKCDEHYLLMSARDIELHFAGGNDGPAPGIVFIHVPDAGQRWKELTNNGVRGLSPVQDQPWGLREFTATDPDGNRIRIGSHPAPPS